MTVKGLYADLRENGGVRGELSSKTIHNIHLTLHTALEEAVRDSKLPRNPADEAHSYSKDDQPEMLFWHEDEFRTFLAHVEEDRLYAMWSTFLWTGARRGEVAAMRWRDLDLDGDPPTWTVRRQYRKGRDGAPEMVNRTKNGKGRTIALTPENTSALRRHRAEQAQEKLLAGQGYEDRDLAFCLEDGTPLNPDGISQRFARHVRASGLKRIRLHDCRHTHGVWSHNNGVPLKVLSERLGHSSVQVTGDLYGHSDEQMQADAYARALGQ